MRQPPQPAAAELPVRGMGSLRIGIFYANELCERACGPILLKVDLCISRFKPLSNIAFIEKMLTSKYADWPCTNWPKAGHECVFSTTG